VRLTFPKEDSQVRFLVGGANDKGGRRRKLSKREQYRERGNLPHGCEREQVDTTKSRDVLGRSQTIGQNTS